MFIETTNQAVALTSRTIDLRYYSPKTKRAYTACLRQFLEVSHDYLAPNQEHIENYLLGLKSLGRAAQTINLHAQAIQFYYRTVLGIPMQSFHIPRAKRPSKLPTVLSKNEIMRAIDAIPNRKHKTMVALAYASGLRVSEVMNLTGDCVDFELQTLKIRNGKGAKDRITIIPQSLFADLIECIGYKDLKEPIFTNYEGKKMHARSIQLVFKRALKKAEVTSDASFHSLRHSFATHLLENGTNIRFIQSLLGHTDIRTTMHYTKIAKTHLLFIKSPFE